MLQENRTTTSGQDPYVKDTPNLIASDKVEGTAVYGRDGERIGSIQRIILEKRGGRVAYAILSFGGFWGIGDDYYPLP
ncbi:MAG: PRC-barrel domain-containing protein, partial [Alphaproteobacteria bacterium]|nr:PRC-barrel domain-containing protein [Alphaproteobacteria bacterium]